VPSRRGFARTSFAGRVDEALGWRPPSRVGGRGRAGNVCLYHFSPGSPAGRIALSAAGRLAVATTTYPARFFASWSVESRGSPGRRSRAPRARPAGRDRLARARSAWGSRRPGSPARPRPPYVHAPAAEGAVAVFRGSTPTAGPTCWRWGGSPQQAGRDLLRAFRLLHARPSAQPLLLVGDRGLRAYADPRGPGSRPAPARRRLLWPRGRGRARRRLRPRRVLVSLSEHEGYGVPSSRRCSPGCGRGLRLRRHGGDDGRRGILLGERRPELVARDRGLVGDPALRRAVLAGQSGGGAGRATDYGALVTEALAPCWRARREPPPVAFVVQRYGRDVTAARGARRGGRALSPSTRYRLHHLCARLRDWRNELPREEEISGVRVRRFPVEERDLAAFNAFAEPSTRAGHARRGDRVPAPAGSSRLPREPCGRRSTLRRVVFLRICTTDYWGLQRRRSGRSSCRRRTTSRPSASRSTGGLRAAPRLRLPDAAERALVERASAWAGGRPVAGWGRRGPPRRRGLPRPHGLPGPTSSTPAASTRQGLRRDAGHHERYRRGRRRADSSSSAASPWRTRQEGVLWLGFLSEEEKAAAIAGRRPSCARAPTRASPSSCWRASPSHPGS